MTILLTELRLVKWHKKLHVPNARANIKRKILNVIAAIVLPAQDVKYTFVVRAKEEL